MLIANWDVAQLEALIRKVGFQSCILKVITLPDVSIMIKRQNRTHLKHSNNRGNVPENWITPHENSTSR